MSQQPTDRSRDETVEYFTIPAPDTVGLTTAYPSGGEQKAVIVEFCRPALGRNAAPAMRQRYRLAAPEARALASLLCAVAERVEPYPGNDQKDCSATATPVGRAGGSRSAPPQVE